MNQVLIKPIQNPQDTPYLDWIEKGEKKFEGRLKSKIDEWSLKEGMKMAFTDGKKTLLVEIIGLPTFLDFGEAYEYLGTSLIPKKMTKEEVIDLYNGFFHYEDEELVSGQTSRMIKDHGVVAINIKPICLL